MEVHANLLLHLGRDIDMRYCITSCNGFFGCKTVVRSVSIATMCQESSSKSAKCVCLCQDPEVHQTISGELAVRPQDCRRCGREVLPRHSISPMLSFKEKYIPRNLYTLYAPTSSHICFQTLQIRPKHIYTLPAKKNKETPLHQYALSMCITSYQFL